MMGNNNDYLNNVMNQLAYVNLHEDFGPGSNLVTALENSGRSDLAKELLKAGYGDYVIKDYENRNGPGEDGFVAIAIEDPTTGDVGMSFRGTENLDIIGKDIGGILFGKLSDIPEHIDSQIDMIDNIPNAVSGESDQARDARAFFARNQSDGGDNYLYGHSKGGELAMEAYVENYENVAEVHIINPQPINWADLTPEQMAAVNNGKVDAVVINGDLVWMLGGVPYPVRIIKNNGSQDGLFGPHDLDSAYYEDGMAVTEMYPFLDYPDQGIMGALALILVTTAQSGYEIGEDITELVFDAYRYLKEEIPEQAQKLWNGLGDAWQNVKEFGGDVMDHVEKFFSDSTDKVHEWWDGLFARDEERTDFYDGGGAGGGGGGGGFRGGRSDSGSSSVGACRVRVDTRLLQQLSDRLNEISRSLDVVENNLSTCRNNLRGFEFFSSAVLRNSMKGTEQAVEKQKELASKLSKAMKEISKLYEQGEGEALQSAQ